MDNIDKLTCIIEYTDPHRVSELSDVWITRNGNVLVGYRRVSVSVNILGVEIFRNNQSFVQGLVGLGKPDDIISTIYRNVIDEIIDRRNDGDRT